MDFCELFFEDDVNMLILPLHHCYGFAGLLVFLSQGMKNVFCDGLKYISNNMKAVSYTHLDVYKRQHVCIILKKIPLQ